VKLRVDSSNGVRVSDFFPPLQLDIFIFLFSKGGMLRSGGHVCGAAADSLIGVYSGDAPPQQLINFILRIPTPATRPSAILLHSTFIQHSQQVAHDRANVRPSPPSLSTLSIADNAPEGDTTSWTKLDKDLGPVTFTHVGGQQVTEDTVVEVIVNNPNTRAVLVCTDEDDDCLVVKLCSASGSVIWEEKDPTVSMPRRDIISPSFSTDGAHLIVYIHSRLNILNAKTGIVQSSFSLGNVVPSAIALSNGAKSIAIHTEKSDGEGNFHKLRIRDGDITHTVHRICVDQPGVRLGYIANGRRLGVCTCVGNWVMARTGFSALGYDVNARTQLFDFTFAPCWQFRALSYSSIKAGGEECHIFVARPGGGDQNNIQVASGDGQRKGEISCGRVVITFLDDGVVFLNEERELYCWTPGEKEVKVASLEGLDVPLLQSIKGMAVSENQVVLVQDDGYFLVYQRRDSSSSSRR
jgi:hypothetical protein